MINLIGFWLVEVPAAFLLARYTGLHARGVYMAIFASQLLIVLASWLVFLRGRWLRTKLLAE